MKRLVKALFILLILVAIVFAGDRCAVYYVQKQLNSALEKDGWQQPETDIKDLPFLPVLWQKEVGELDLRASSWQTVIDETVINVQNIQVRLLGVALDDKWSPSAVQRGQGKAELNTDELSKLVENYYRGIKISTNDGKLRASTSFYGIPVGFDLNVEAAGKNKDGYPQIRIAPAVGESLRNLPDLGRQGENFKENLTKGFPIVFDQAPQGISIDGVEVSKGRIVVTFSGDNIELMRCRTRCS